MSDQCCSCCSGLFDWIRRKWSQIRRRRSREREIQRPLRDDGDGRYELCELLRNDSSVVNDDRNEIGEWPPRCRWNVLSRASPRFSHTFCISKIFSITTPVVRYYGSKESSWCTSFVKVYRNGSRRRIYQHPFACPTAPLQRLTYDLPLISGPVYYQLHPRKTLIAEYSEHRVRTDYGTDTICTLMVFDLDQQKNSYQLRRRVQAPEWQIICAVFMEHACDHELDSEIKFIYYEGPRYDEHKLSHRITVNVYSNDLFAVTPDQNLPLHLVDSKTWNFSDPQGKFSVAFCKSVDNEYFVWFLKFITPDMLDVNYTCVTYHRGDDGIWQWSEKPMPLLEWATTTEQGRRFWAAAELLKEIWDHVKDWDRFYNDDVRRLHMLEVKYNEGMIFAHSPNLGYYRRYAFRAPSLQSMAADVVRDLIEAEIEETKSLATLNWWRKLVGAAGLFEPCPSDYGEEELKAEDFL